MQKHTYQIFVHFCGIGALLFKKGQKGRERKSPSLLLISLELIILPSSLFLMGNLPAGVEVKVCF